jgi:hypothetical protein
MKDREEDIVLLVQIEAEDGNFLRNASWRRLEKVVR